MGLPMIGAATLPRSVAPERCGQATVPGARGGEATARSRAGAGIEGRVARKSMSNPLRKCTRCNLRVEVLSALDDGRLYCRSCAVIVEARHADPARTPEPRTPVPPAAPIPPAALRPIQPPASTSARDTATRGTIIPMSEAIPAPAATPRRLSSLRDGSDPASAAASSGARETLSRVSALLEEQQRLEARRAELEAELAQVDEGLLQLNERVGRIQERLAAAGE